MGEEAKQEEVKAKAKPEEKKEEPPQPPSPVVLYIDLHCVGCAKKIEKLIMKIRGVEAVVIDMAQNQVTLKGVVDPQVACNMIMKRTKRRVKVISPSLPAAEGEAAAPQLGSSQVCGSTTVELNVNMHCEACAEQLKRKILKMRGVQTAATELSTGKVTVTGTMEADKLVDYVYRRTRKQARIVPRPEPELEKKEEEKEAEKPAEETKAEGKKEENGEQKSEDKPEEKKGNKGEEEGGGESKEEEAEKEGEEEQEAATANHTIVDDEGMRRMMHYYQSLYVIERLPPPQLFSDENPNACCIS
ncbi:heavy metal-associated isoprenylated plant protein 9-like [Rhodamnia argentea]|uniref:Heavy metal-associated isoprenylated plant protein 9-like n=1 Tax=Rhodamnia argentea TaxID=178133 RepID=A0A8B8N5P6_9MYRT|nr:heavy metal-associated isoprenylated plant protein 9-like [Rhodamnia argentea]